MSLASHLSLVVRAFTTFIVSASLVACGGGGGGGAGGGFLPDNSDSSPAPSYTIAIRPSVTPAVVSLGSPLGLDVQVLDKDGTPIQGAIVDMTASLGALDFNSNITSEGANGDTAPFILTYAGVSGSGTITAQYESASGEIYAQTLTVLVTSPEAPTISFSGLSGSASPKTITVTVTPNDYVSGDYKIAADTTIITLSTDLGEIVGNRRQVLITNDQGTPQDTRDDTLEASFTLLSDGASGSGTVTASLTVGGTTFTNTGTIPGLDAPYSLAVTSITSSDDTPVGINDLNGKPLVRLTTASPLRVNNITFELRGADNVVQPNRLLRIASSRGVLTPSSGFVLTNSAGQAVVQLAYDETVSAGPGILTATYSTSSGDVVSETEVQVVEPDLLLGYFEVNGDPLTDFDVSDTAITTDEFALVQGSIVAEIAAGDPVTAADRNTDEQFILFDSFCLANGNASIDGGNPLRVTNGVIQAVYRPTSLCVGEESLTATLLIGGESTRIRSTPVVIDVTLAESARVLSFEDATTELISLEGLGAATSVPEQTTVRFRVLDSNGDPIENEDIRFALTSTLGNARLLDSAQNPLSNPVATDGQGYASVIVQSGSMPTTTYVSGEVIATGQRDLSNPIVISTAIPDADSFSLFAETLNIPLAAGLVRTFADLVTVVLADRNNNFVPDNYTVNFISEFGAIEPSCTTAGGTSSCSVNFVSSAPFPGTGLDLSLVSCDFYTQAKPELPCPTGFDMTLLADGSDATENVLQGARVTILASGTGEESFTDLDGDGLYTAANDAFNGGVAEPYLDANDNAAFDDGLESFIDTELAGIRNGQYDDAAQLDGLVAGDPDIFSGLGCSQADVDAANCRNGMVSLFDNLSLIYADPDPANYYLALVRQGVPPRPPLDFIGAGKEGDYEAYIAGLFNNVPPVGAEIAVAATGACVLGGATEYVVGNTSQLGPYRVDFSVTAVGNIGDELTITLTYDDVDAGSRSRSWTFPCGT